MIYYDCQCVSSYNYQNSHHSDFYCNIEFLKQNIIAYNFTEKSLKIVPFLTGMVLINLEVLSICLYLCFFH